MKRVTAEKVNVYKGFRAFEKSRSESRLHAPKRRALPAAPHPDIVNKSYYNTLLLEIQDVWCILNAFLRWIFNIYNYL